MQDHASRIWYWSSQENQIQQTLEAQQKLICESILNCLLDISIYHISSGLLPIVVLPQVVIASVRETNLLGKNRLLDPAICSSIAGRVCPRICAQTHRLQSIS